MQKYQLEFILHIQNNSAAKVKSALAEFGEGLEITDSQEDNGKGKDLKVHINTDEPEVIFDVCAQFGRIKSAKVDEIK